MHHRQPLIIYFFGSKCSLASSRNLSSVSSGRVVRTVEVAELETPYWNLRASCVTVDAPTDTTNWDVFKPLWRDLLCLFPTCYWHNWNFFFHLQGINPVKVVPPPRKKKWEYWSATCSPALMTVTHRLMWVCMMLFIEPGGSECHCHCSLESWLTQVDYTPLPMWRQSIPTAASLQTHTSTFPAVSRQFFWVFSPPHKVIYSPVHLCAPCVL